MSDREYLDSSTESVLGPGATSAKPDSSKVPGHRSRSLPPWKVLLHNDDVNHFDDVVRAVYQLTPLGAAQARSCVLEADHSGVALVLLTHRERAELYVEQFLSRGLTATAEPA